MSTPPSNEEHELTAELKNLRLLRAALESVRQLVVGIHVDTAITTPKNYAAVEALAEQWEGVLEEVGRGSNELAVEKGKNEGKRKAGA